jgi:hypothetical protein
MNPSLVFASGVLVTQKIAGLDYFKDLPARYPSETPLSPVSKLGSVELRAQELAALANKFQAGRSTSPPTAWVASMRDACWRGISWDWAPDVSDPTRAPGFKEPDPVPDVRYFAYAGAGLAFPTHLYIKTGRRRQ